MSGPTVSIALCDDELQEQKRLRGIVEGIFVDAGFEVRLTTYNTLDELAVALPDRPHFVFVDNVFSAADNAGVQFIAKHKPAYPDVVFILMTGATFNVDQLGFRLPNPDMIATKSHVIEHKYQKYIGECLGKLSRRYPMETASILEPDRFPLAQNLPVRQLNSLVEQVVFESGLIVEADQLRAQLRPLTGGYSGAAVLEMRLTGVTRAGDIPTAVKIAPRAWIEEEVRAFSSFVKWQLPHSFRVDIVGTGFTKDWGAIGYAYVLAGELESSTVTESLRRGSKKAVDRVVSDIFRSGSTAWYKPLTGANQDLANKLANSREFDSEKDTRRDDALAASLERVAEREGLPFKRDINDFQCGTLSLPRLRRAIFQRAWGPAEECFSHGDLNSNNIIINGRQTKLALIDFADSGRTQVFRDFISFESSIRAEWVTSEAEKGMPLAALVAAETEALREEKSASLEYLKQVQKVRQAAFAKFPGANKKHYWICLALNSWKVNAVRQWTVDAERRTVAVYAACIGALR